MSFRRDVRLGIIFVVVGLLTTQGAIDTVISHAPAIVGAWLMSSEHLQWIGFSLSCFGVWLLAKIAWDSATNADLAKKTDERMTALEAQMATLEEKISSVAATGADIQSMGMTLFQEYRNRFANLDVEFADAKKSSHQLMMQRVQEFNDMTSGLVNDHSGQIARLEAAVREIESRQAKETGSGEE